MTPEFYTHEEVRAQAAKRPDGYLAELVPAIIEQDEHGVTYDAEHPVWRAAMKKYRKHKKARRRASPPQRKAADDGKLRCTFAPDEGPGTHLHRMLGRLGIKPGANCKCLKRACEMNRWGADECTRRIDEIVGWLKEEADNRKLPFSATVAKQVVKRAIAKART